MEQRNVTVKKRFTGGGATVELRASRRVEKIAGGTVNGGGGGESGGRVVQVTIGSNSMRSKGQLGDQSTNRILTAEEKQKQKPKRAAVRKAGEEF